MRYFVSTPIGIESFAASELRELGASSIEVGRGRVFFEAGEDFIYLGNFMLRTVNRLHILLGRYRFSTLNDIGEFTESIDYRPYISPNQTFAVRAERVGNHDFTSVDVGRVVGESVINSYLENKGVRLKVDLRNPDVVFRAYVVNDEFVLGVDTTGIALDKRGYRRYNHPAAIKSTLAAALAMLAGLRPGWEGVVLDPLCGGGTVVAEAAHRILNYPLPLFRLDYAFRKLPLHNREAEADVLTRLLSGVVASEPSLICVDVSRKHLEGAELNLTHALVREYVHVVRGDSTDVRTLSSLLDVDVIVTNPPYGIRSHSLKRIGGFYRSLLHALRDRFGGVRVALITASWKQLREAALEEGFRVVEELPVLHGGLWTRMFLLSG